MFRSTVRSGGRRLVKRVSLIPCTNYVLLCFLASASPRCRRNLVKPLQVKALPGIYFLLVNKKSGASKEATVSRSKHVANHTHEITAVRAVFMDGWGFPCGVTTVPPPPLPAGRERRSSSTVFSWCMDPWCWRVAGTVQQQARRVVWYLLRCVLLHGYNM